MSASPVKSRPTTRQPKVTPTTANEWLVMSDGGYSAKSIAGIAGYCESAVERHTKLARDLRDNGNVVPIRATTPNAPMSLEYKRNEALRLAAKYQAEINEAERDASIKAGDSVCFKFGRAAKSRTLTGNVFAIGDTSNGRKLAVLVGDTVEAELHRIAFKDIITHRAA